MRGTWDEVIDLVSVELLQDTIGNSIEQAKHLSVYAMLRSATRSERQQLGHDDLGIELVFIVHPYEYDNQPYVEYNADKYIVMHTYQIDNEHLELKCRKRIGDDNGYS